jgi:hypothetical protein
MKTRKTWNATFTKKPAFADFPRPTRLLNCRWFRKPTSSAALHLLQRLFRKSPRGLPLDLLRAVQHHPNIEDDIKVWLSISAVDNVDGHRQGRITGRSMCGLVGLPCAKTACLDELNNLYGTGRRRSNDEGECVSAKLFNWS